ncbi:peptide ABC transporter substrate-binding protein [Propionibacterium cyclohexanicum]|uniref:peptide ABC transporter substrate-binding protein n=1 Tax=Propionibacterium cyclohexanicum TaxID=64702 RepID=UPI001FE13DE9|nr:ABC transporter substrate-binding protein [Propionibacterium cyclohexanicum]
MKKKTRLSVALAAAALSVAMALTGCSSSSNSSGGSSTAGSTTAVISANTTEPQNPLIPGNTNEVGGGKVVDLLWAGLISYEPDGTTKNEVAQSIDTTDNKTFTVKLKDWKFSNGEPVTAHSFVDAWNYTALSTNAQLNAAFPTLTQIEGYDAVSADKPTAQTLSGLKVIDDKTFTITLTAPSSTFPLSLGYSAFYPLPKEAFSDMKAFGEKPIGDGPYTLSSWQHNKEIDLAPNPDYNGNRKAANGGVKLVIYTDLNAAYSDVQAGNLDVLDQVPASALSTYTTDDTVQAISKPGSVFQSFTIPQSLDHFGNNEEGRLRRQAISEAIDRPTITKTIFSGSRTPAVDFTAPVIPGYNGKLSGNGTLSYNPSDAKAKWAQADAISKFDGTFNIAYNADGDHKAWVDAVANSIKNTLGIQAQGQPIATFSDFRSQITKRQLKSAFRSGWQADYPSADDYLAPLYATAKPGTSSNDGDYSNPDFDKAIADAEAATSASDRQKFYDQAQEILLKDLPAIPLWYQNVSAVSAKGTKNVAFNYQNVPVYNAITK